MILTGRKLVTRWARGKEPFRAEFRMNPLNVLGEYLGASPSRPIMSLLDSVTTFVGELRDALDQTLMQSYYFASSREPPIGT